MKLKIIQILVLIAVIFVFISVVGCFRQEPIAIENMILAAKVDDNGNPTEETQNFKENTKEIYLVIKVKNMQNTDNITVKWTYLDKGLEIDSKSFTPESKFTGNKIFKIKISQGFPFGNYEVRIFLNGTQLKTIPFKVN
ncbi:MAG: hypothetical protein M1475_05070 [Actinobacteria bacterium]|nr:hypothetical protein [Actinomycetota bacterium]MCL6087763.1 hypothetical protein [Actinomycetota bacterium]